MTKSEKKHDSLPHQLEQQTDPVEAKEIVSFNQSMGRVVDCEPLPGDELIVIRAVGVVWIVKFVRFPEVHFVDEVAFGQQRKRAVNRGSRD